MQRKRAGEFGVRVGLALLAQSRVLERAQSFFAAHASAAFGESAAA
jgi:hypothetical protein